MKHADLLKRIEQLEARIRQLEAIPHYPAYPVRLEPWPTIVVGPWRHWEQPTCGAAVGGGSITITNGPHHVGYSC